MTYGPIVSDEAQNPTYEILGMASTANGSAVFSARLDVETNDPLFTPEADALFQEILDALGGIVNLDLSVARKAWGAARTVTPTP